MDGIALIVEAAAAGLSIRLDGDRVVIRGPKSADAVARRLLANKPAVVAVLRKQSPHPNPAPAACNPTAPDPFDNCTLRPNDDDRIGKKAPGLPEAARR